jgi:MFS transporter, DHA1 family, chloramphenicol resistance protein
MPIAVYVLGLSIFAQGTSELMLAGLLPQVADGLGVSIPRAGLLISAFAIGMLVGAPLLAVVTLRWPRRATLLAFLGVFAAAHVVGALAPNYAMLLASRVVGAFVYAGFWAVGAVAAVSLVPADARGRAMSVVAGGLSVATLVGVPLGTALGQHLGWRSVFWVLAALAVAVMVGVRATLPPGRPDPASLPKVADELRTMAQPRLWLAYGTTALATGSVLVIQSYVAPLLTETAGLDAGWVPVVLALNGIAGVLGIAAGGRTADAHPVRTLHAGLAATVVVAVAIAVLSGSALLAVVFVVLLGAAGFVVNPALNTRVFAIAGGAPTLATATNVSAFNVGITVGPWLGGLALGAGADYAVLGWIGAGLAVLAVGTVALAPRQAVSVPDPVPATP